MLLVAIVADIFFIPAGKAASLRSPATIMALPELIQYKHVFTCGCHAVKGIPVAGKVKPEGKSRPNPPVSARDERAGPSPLS